MDPIIIDQEMCVGCELCYKDCPVFHIEMKEGKAQTTAEQCIECGHCYAICPQGAVTMTNYEGPEGDVVPLTEFPSDTFLQALRSRRSVRQFTGQPVEQEKIDMILEAGRYSPTAKNRQNIAYTILGSRQQEIEAICVSMFRKGTDVPKRYAEMPIDDHFFFKKAPLVIVVSGKAVTDAGMASSYMELMAANLGLGVMYCGFFVACTRFNSELLHMLDLPEEHEVVSCLVIGYPAVTYQRLVPRKPVQCRVL